MSWFKIGTALLVGVILGFILTAVAVAVHMVNGEMAFTIAEPEEDGFVTLGEVTALFEGIVIDDTDHDEHIFGAHGEVVLPEEPLAIGDQIDIDYHDDKFFVTCVSCREGSGDKTTDSLKGPAPERGEQ